jgi:hypothetical protein
MTDPQDYDFSKFCAQEGVAVEEHRLGLRVLPLVLSDLKERAARGYEKYQNDYRVYTRPNALEEAYEEALDLCMYLRAAIEQRGSIE